MLLALELYHILAVIDACQLAQSSIDRIDGCFQRSDCSFS